jgi:S-adenosylmethionine:tRNA ribosyltransferase-isomerase
MTDHGFLELPDLLEPGDVVVVNETRVRAARLTGKRRGTSGKVELLLLEQSPDGTWETLARPSRRLHPGVVIDFDGFSATVTSVPDDGKISVSLDADDAEAAIGRAGVVPLPPYFIGHLESPDRYQTVFAAATGSAAAPTAGLHFTEAVIERLRHKGIAIATVDLHVSLDTFRPMTAVAVEDHRMHSEWCSVPESTAAAILGARARGTRVVAIGTTVVRALETMADGGGVVTPGERRTDLFLRPGGRIEVVDALVTNFHLPRSTLLVLLAAFMGERWRDAYTVALERGYRFLSFGDAMLAVRHRS